MSTIETHTGTVTIDADLVRRLVAAQFPQWVDLAIRPVEFDGWDNRTFHLGAQMTVRLPSADRYTFQVEKEHRWLPKLAPQLPLPIPVPLAMGVPGEGYPWHWSVYRWLAGETAATWRGSPVWFHGDIAAGNLLVERGRLSAVIDFGTSGVGDPACDLAIAWTLFAGESREAFRAALPADEATWARGRGWTLWKALITLAGNIDTNSAEAGKARRVIDEVLADHRHAP